MTEVRDCWVAEKCALGGGGKPWLVVMQAGFPQAPRVPLLGVGLGELSHDHPDLQGPLAAG